jgi:hypothetical protein
VSSSFLGPVCTTLILHSEEHHKRVKKSNLSCPFFPEASIPKTRSRTTSTRSTARPKSRAGSRQRQTAPSENSASRSEDDSQPAPAPPRLAKRSRTISTTATAKEIDTSDALRRSTRSSRARPPSEPEEDATCTEPRGSTIRHRRGKSLAKGKGKGPIEVIEEADEDDIPRATHPTKQRVKGNENVAQDAKVPKPSRKPKPFRANDTEEEAHQPKRPKKDQALVDEREESTPDVESETDVRPAAKRRNRIVQSVSSIEEPDEDTKPKKVPAPAKRAKGQASIDEPESTDGRIDETEEPSRPAKKVPSKAPTMPPAKPEVIEDSNDEEPEEVATKAKPSPPLERNKEKVRPRPVTPSETSEAAVSPSNDEEEMVARSTAPTEKLGRVANGKGSKSARVAASHHGHSRSQTTSGASSSASLPLKGKAKAASSSSQGVEDDVQDIDSDIAWTPPTSPRGTTETTAKLPSILPSECESDADMDGVVPAPPTHSPQHLEPPTLRREKSPATPPPASSSLLSMSSATSTTKVESHTDTETLVESLPLRTNGAQLTEEERMMTVEQWIRHEIEVQYERLRQDSEMKIRLFKERAEEVRRQIEAL